MPPRPEPERDPDGSDRDVVLHSGFVLVRPGAARWAFGVYCMDSHAAVVRRQRKASCTRDRAVGPGGPGSEDQQ